MRLLQRLTVTFPALRHTHVSQLIAEGLDVQRDVVDRMGFAPQIADDLKPIDPRVYADGVMGLAR